MIIEFISDHWFIIGIVLYYAVLRLRWYLRWLSKRLDRQHESDRAREEYNSAQLHSTWLQGYAQGQENTRRQVA